MCRISSSSKGSSPSSSSSAPSSSVSPSAWYSYFVSECQKRGVEPDALVGGELGNSLRQNAGSLPSLRLRERAWMQLLANESGPETRQAFTASAERLDEPEPVRRQIR